jgi:hypothetical protein
MKSATIAVAAVFAFSATLALAQTSGGMGGGRGGSRGSSAMTGNGSARKDSPMTGYTGNALSNGITLNGTGGNAGPNARAAESRGTTGKAMDAAKSLGNTNTGILAPGATTGSNADLSGRGTSPPP